MVISTMNTRAALPDVERLNDISIGVYVMNLLSNLSNHWLKINPHKWGFSDESISDTVCQELCGIFEACFGQHVLSVSGHRFF